MWLQCTRLNVRLSLFIVSTGFVSIVSVKRWSFGEAWLPIFWSSRQVHVCLLGPCSCTTEKKSNFLERFIFAQLISESVKLKLCVFARSLCVFTHFFACDKSGCLSWFDALQGNSLPRRLVVYYLKANVLTPYLGPMMFVGFEIAITFVCSYLLSAVIE